MAVCGLLLLAFSQQTEFPAGLILITAAMVPITVVNTALSPMLHFRATIGGLHLGRIDTIFSVVGILFPVSVSVAYFTLPSPSDSLASENSAPDQDPVSDPDPAPAN